MSLYNRPRRHRNSGPSAGGYHLRQRRRRFEEQLSPRPGGPPSGLLSDAEFLIDSYYALRAGGGHAPGPDGLTYWDLGPGEVALVLREAAAAVRRGDYRSGPVAAAIPSPAATRTRRSSTSRQGRRPPSPADALSRPSSCRSYGFRPGLGAQDLLADLMAAMAASQTTTLAVDDVKKAFDFVPTPLMRPSRSTSSTEPAPARESPARRRGPGPRRGTPRAAPSRRAQRLLHHVHDLPGGGRDLPPFYRYADNLVYPCRACPRARGPGPCPTAPGRTPASPWARRRTAVDPCEGRRQAIGFHLSMRGDRLHPGLGEDALKDMAPSLIEAHDDTDPDRAAWTAPGVGRVVRPGPRRTDGYRRRRDTRPRHGTGSARWPHGRSSGWCTASARWTGRYTTALGAWD
ncbi:MAG: hypothetical protein WKF75_12840 [Singulisphaera sp.]